MFWENFAASPEMLLPDPIQQEGSGPDQALWAFLALFMVRSFLRIFFSWAGYLDPALWQQLPRVKYI